MTVNIPIGINPNPFNRLHCSYEFDITHKIRAFEVISGKHFLIIVSDIMY